MKILSLAVLSALTALSISPAMLATVADDRAKVDEQLRKSAAIIHELTNTNSSLGIPPDVIKNAKCIAVLPDMKQGGYVKPDRGEGVATCKLEGGRWSAPGAFQLTGGGFGAKTATDTVDLVLIVTNASGMKSLQSGSFRVGTDVDVAAGPTGRKATAQDAPASTDILTYTKSKGVYASVIVQGAEINQDNNATSALYGKDIEGKDTNFADILNGSAAANDAAVNKFLETIQVAQVKAKSN